MELTATSNFDVVLENEVSILSLYWENTSEITAY